MTDATWSCTACNTNNPATSGTCRRCARPIDDVTPRDARPAAGYQGAGWAGQQGPGQQQPSQHGPGQQYPGQHGPGQQGPGGFPAPPGPPAAPPPWLAGGYTTAPPPPPPPGAGGSAARGSGSLVAVIAIVMVVVVLGGTGAYVLSQVNQTVSPTAQSGGAPSLPITVLTNTEAPATTTTTVQASPQQLLQQQIDADRQQVEALVGSWVPQISSKSNGLIANGVTYGYQSIYADYQSWKQRYPDALLLWSGDFPTFKAGNFYVLVIPQAYGSGQDANSWCDDAGLSADDCYAKLLAHTGSYRGATLNRG